MTDGRMGGGWQEGRREGGQEGMQDKMGNEGGKGWKGGKEGRREGDLPVQHGVILVRKKKEIVTSVSARNFTCGRFLMIF